MGEPIERKNAGTHQNTLARECHRRSPWILNRFIGTKTLAISGQISAKSFLPHRYEIRSVMKKSTPYQRHLFICSLSLSYSPGINISVTKGKWIIELYLLKFQFFSGTANRNRRSQEQCGYISARSIYLPRTQSINSIFSVPLALPLIHLWLEVVFWGVMSWVEIYNIWWK